MITRRLMVLATACLVALMPVRLGVAANDQEPDVGANGLHTQPWLLESFLELGDDLAAAAAEGKHFAVLFEQRGCGSCRRLHQVNFADERIKRTITGNFEVLQLDLHGSREVTDFDGEALEERALARKWRVNFTPTMAFFPKDPTAVRGKHGRDAEVFRMPGYFSPFQFHTMLEFVHGGVYADMGLPDYMLRKSAELRANGVEPADW